MRTLEPGTVVSGRFPGLSFLRHATVLHALDDRPGWVLVETWDGGRHERRVHSLRVVRGTP